MPLPDAVEICYMQGFKNRGQPAGFIDKIFTFMLRILYNLNKNFLTIGTGMVYYLPVYCERRLI